MSGPGRSAQHGPERASDPFGHALADHWAGAPDALVTLVRSDGYRDEMPVAPYFAPLEEAEPIDPRPWLEGLAGPVLDVGAGAGRVALHLQAAGLRVTAIDVSPRACAVMRERGVEDVRQRDVMELDPGALGAGPPGGGGFATILLMGAGIGMAGSLPGLEGFLTHLRSLLTGDGCVILDSLDVRRTRDPGHLAYQRANEAAGRYRGDIRFAVEYRGRRGDEFGWLHVDPRSLAERARKAGFASRVLIETPGGAYLARLTPIGRAQPP